MRQTKTRYINDLKTWIQVSFLAIFTFSSSGLLAQDLDNEAGFLYLKAKYLYETDRHEEAIREFNKVILEIPDYEDALVIRAKSKFALAAYKGAELDALEFIKVKGITPDVSIILGQSQYELENYEAAKNTLVTAVQLNPNNPDPLELLAKMAKSEGELLSACNYWSTAAKLGSSKARANTLKYCGEIIEPEIKTPPKTEEEDIISIGTKLEEEEEEIPSDNTLEEEDEIISVGTRMEDEERQTESPAETEDSTAAETKTRELEISKVQKPGESESTDQVGEPTSPVDTTTAKPVVEEKVDEELLDDTSHDIVVDEDLTLHIFGQGLGKREIIQTPNILILSESDGKVAIDICVNRQGRVERAEFNSELSTIGKKSLISLALRKSKDFWFEKYTKYKEQCGVIIFDIKGS